MLILMGLLLGVIIFIAAIGTLVATQVADLAQRLQRVLLLLKGIMLGIGAAVHGHGGGLQLHALPFPRGCH